jgi:hypothetical protein
MDIATRTGKIAAFILVLASTATLGTPNQPGPVREPVRIFGADPAQERTVDWAVQRFGAAGLPDLPTLDIYLHTSHAGCRGNLGYYRQGRVDLCTKESSEAYARKFALHEMAHAWVEVHVDAELRSRFFELRGISDWNDLDQPWKERGTEQAAEVIAWGLGEGEVSPLLSEPPATADLVAAYVLLTGHQPITPAGAA